MKKRIYKLLIGCLTTILISSSTINAVSINWDKIYKSAYISMREAESKKTQQCINEARKYIDELLKNKDLISIASTLSCRVDKVQQELFVRFYDLIYINGNKKTRMSQHEINVARDYINDFSSYDGNKIYIPSWSSAIDKYQQKIIDVALNDIVKVEKSKEIEDLKFAKESLNELETCTDEYIKEYCKQLQKRMIIVEKDIVKDLKEKEEKDIESKIDSKIIRIQNNIDGKIKQLEEEKKNIIKSEVNAEKSKIDKEIKEAKEQFNKKVDEDKKVLIQEIDIIKTEIKKISNDENKKKFEKIVQYLEKVINKNMKYI